MTEKEFMRQVWRPYDIVEIDGGLKGRVTNVCFPTRSCRVTISQDVHEWIKCDMIINHTSVSGATEDVAIIEDLHHKLMAANERNNDLQDIVTQLKMKVNGGAKAEELGKIRKAGNKIVESICAIQSRLRRLDELLTKLEAEESEE